MKNAVLVFVSGIFGMLILLFVMTINGRMNRSVEIQSQLSNALEMTVERMMQQETPYEKREAVAECVEYIVAVADTDSAFTVEVYQEDVKKGGLAIRVMETFCHPGGRTGVTEADRMVIYNCVPESVDESYEVCFYESREKMQSGGKCYKSYVVKKGEHVIQPASPVISDGRFLGWKDVNDYIADFSLPVEQNRIYYAEWE